MESRQENAVAFLKNENDVEEMFDFKLKGNYIIAVDRHGNIDRDSLYSVAADEIDTAAKILGHVTQLLSKQWTDKRSIKSFVDSCMRVCPELMRIYNS